jgi:hypothetical protein
VSAQHADDVAPRRASRFTPEELARFGGEVDKNLVRKVMRERRIRQGLICGTCGEWPEYCGCPALTDGQVAP